MHAAMRICDAPENLAAFVAEISPPFDALYGATAGAFYRSTAIPGITASISSPEVHAYGCMDRNNAAGMLLLREDGDRKVLYFLHVLLPYRGLGLEERLLDYALRDLGESLGAVLTEFVPYYAMALDDAFKRHGFEKIDRQLMRRTPWKSPAQTLEGFALRAVDTRTLPDLAEVLVEVYAAHRERFLFPEAQTLENAQVYLNRVQLGGFGSYRPGFGIAAWRGDRCAGFLIGAQVLPGLGFTLHLAVRNTFRGLGLGSALLSALAMAFAEEGLDYIALGVTCDNPAVSLYQRAGFDCVKQVPVYHRL